LVNSVIHGDCLDVLRTLPDNSIDSVVTDPPYGIDYQSCRRIDPTKRHPKIANDKRPFIWWLYDAYRVTKEGGALVCFCRWDVAEIFKIAIEVAGFTVKSQVVWDREVHGMGDLKSSFAPCHDIIWFATKGKFVFPSKRPKSVIRITRVSPESLVHPNEKPVELMIELVKSVTPPGGIVLDPFAGSGSTLVAAQREGFSFIGIECDPKYVEIARRRLAERQTLIPALV
jgi:DNA modification methylase